MTEQAQKQIGILKSQFATENENAVRDYSAIHGNWAINNSLRFAAKLPPETEPPSPLIKSLNEAIAAELFEVWDAAVIQRAKEFNPITVLPDGTEVPTPALPELQPDYSPAIIFTPYVAPAGTPGPVNEFVSELVGPVIEFHPKGLRRILGSKFQGKTKLGTRALGPDGKTYVLVDSMSPFNRTGEWEPVAA